MHHLHNSQVEVFLQDSETESSFTQQHRSPFICVHVLGQPRLRGREKNCFNVDFLV